VGWVECGTYGRPYVYSTLLPILATDSPLIDNVPNALMFIGQCYRLYLLLTRLTCPFQDKYSQIYRILLPICNAISHIPSLAGKPALHSYIDDEFGSTDNLVREILGDFFRHGFDGSGAENFIDAGSCVDGVSMYCSYHRPVNPNFGSQRLTSAWNWCATLEKKRFFPVFLLTGASYYLSIIIKGHARH